MELFTTILATLIEHDGSGLTLTGGIVFVVAVTVIVTLICWLIDRISKW